MEQAKQFLREALLLQQHAKCEEALPIYQDCITILRSALES